MQWIIELLLSFFLLLNVKWIWILIVAITCEYIGWLNGCQVIDLKTCYLRARDINLIICVYEFFLALCLCNDTLNIFMFFYRTSKWNSFRYSFQRKPFLNGLARGFKTLTLYKKEVLRWYLKAMIFKCYRIDFILEKKLHTKVIFHWRVLWRCFSNHHIM